MKKFLGKRVLLPMVALVVVMSMAIGLAACGGSTSHDTMTVSGFTVAFNASRNFVTTMTMNYGDGTATATITRNGDRLRVLSQWVYDGDAGSEETIITRSGNRVTRYFRHSEENNNAWDVDTMTIPSGQTWESLVDVFADRAIFTVAMAANWVAHATLEHNYVLSEDTVTSERDDTFDDLGFDERIISVETMRAGATLVLAENGTMTITGTFVTESRVYHDNVLDWEEVTASNNVAVIALGNAPTITAPTVA